MSDQTKLDDGGPAFPVNIIVPELGHNEGRYEVTRQEQGISRRDYFAAKAMAAMLVDHGDICDGYREQIALKAYIMADAMLSQSKKGKP